MSALLSVIRAIPAALSIVQALVSLVRQLRDMAHKKALENMDKAETKEQVKDALDDVAKNP